MAENEAKSKDGYPQSYVVQARVREIAKARNFNVSAEFLDHLSMAVGEVIGRAMVRADGRSKTLLAKDL